MSCFDDVIRDGEKIQVAVYIHIYEYIYEVCLKSNKTVCAAQVMCSSGISAVCYNVG